MITNKEQKIIDEQKKITGIEPVISIKRFAELFLASMAEKNNNNGVYKLKLYLDYKNAIEEILYDENGWASYFSEIIDIYTYYEAQLEWEEELGRNIKEVIIESKKPISYSFEKDYFEMGYTKEEIDYIKNMYDKDTLNQMNSFTNLVISFSNKREKELNQKIYEKRVQRNKS